ncbi:MAG TPA: hypothetical protein VLI21_05400 [Casimicrobiaceae bacterium]|nr:hypothetical protein [Casimicrobiaceae bacterium]
MNSNRRGHPRKTLDLPETDDPRDLLRALMRCPQVGVTLRLKAAQLLLRHGDQAAPPPTPSGKKARKQRDAHEAANGRFAPKPTPLRLLKRDDEAS